MERKERQKMRRNENKEEEERKGKSRSWLGSLWQPYIKAATCSKQPHTYTHKLCKYT